MANLEYVHPFDKMVFYIEVRHDTRVAYIVQNVEITQGAPPEIDSDLCVSNCKVKKPILYAFLSRSGLTCPACSIPCCPVPSKIALSYSTPEQILDSFALQEKVNYLQIYSMAAKIRGRAIFVYDWSLYRSPVNDFYSPLCQEVDQSRYG